MKRTLAKETVKKVGKEVLLKGWVDTVRDHGKITFVDLRDRSGKVQCVGEKLPKFTVESVVEISGKVVKRPEKLINKELETGEVEVQIDKLKVLTEASEIPLPLEGDGYDIDEKVRNKYRYLDLRRARMAGNMRVRFQTTQFMRNWLEKEGFVSVRQKGSHRFYRHPDGRTTVVPIHANRDISRGLLVSLAGVNLCLPAYMSSGDVGSSVISVLSAPCSNIASMKSSIASWLRPNKSRRISVRSSRAIRAPRSA